MSQLDIQIHPAVPPGPTMASVSGEVDRCSAPELLRQLDEVLDAGLVLDLSEVEFLDIGGLRALLALDGRVRSAGHRLVLSSVSWPVQLVLDTVELADPFVTAGPSSRS